MPSANAVIIEIFQPLVNRTVMAFPCVLLRAAKVLAPASLTELDFISLDFPIPTRTTLQSSFHSEIILPDLPSKSSLAIADLTCDWPARLNPVRERFGGLSTPSKRGRISVCSTVSIGPT